MPKAIKIQKVMYAGQMNTEDFKEGVTDKEIIQQCGEIMNEHCTEEILGTPVFKGTDGKHYAVKLVVAVIDEISKQEADELSEDYTEIG